MSHTVMRVLTYLVYLWVATFTTAPLRLGILHLKITTSYLSLFWGGGGGGGGGGAIGAVCPPATRYLLLDLLLILPAERAEAGYLTDGVERARLEETTKVVPVRLLPVKEWTLCVCVCVCVCVLWGVVVRGMWEMWGDDRVWVWSWAIISEWSTAILGETHPLAYLHHLGHSQRVFGNVALALFAGGPARLGVLCLERSFFFLGHFDLFVSI